MYKRQLILVICFLFSVTNGFTQSGINQSPTGFANLYLVLYRVDTLLSVEGVIKRNNQPQWHSISQMGNDRDGHSGAVY